MGVATAGRSSWTEAHERYLATVSSTPARARHRRRRVSQRRARGSHERVERLTESMRAPLGRCTLQPSRLSHRHTDDGTIETETFFIDQPRNPPQRPSLRRETRRQ